jgi:Raf kinase inhibitor-like YbhB/YbcL family protein
MKVTSQSFDHGAAIPSEFAFAKHNPESHVEMCDNKNPHLAWTDVPDGTKSFAIVCHDPDVPSKPDDVNQEGKTVPADLPRVDFYHWALCDLAADVREIAAGAFSSAVTPRGKDGPAGPKGTRQGLNNYTQWFEGDDAMEGEYFGYDGPCPPWNDSIVHHYHFTVYALDVDEAPVEGTFDAPALLGAIDGHILGKASVMGTYTINPDAK